MNLKIAFNLFITLAFVLHFQPNSFSQSKDFSNGYFINIADEIVNANIKINEASDKIIYYSDTEPVKKEIGFISLKEIHFPTQHYLIISDTINSMVDYLLASQLIEGDVDLYSSEDIYEEDVFFVMKDENLIRINRNNPGSALEIILGDCDGMKESKLSKPQTISYIFKHIYDLVLSYNTCKGNPQTSFVQLKKRKFEIGFRLLQISGTAKFPADLNDEPAILMDGTTYRSFGFGFLSNIKVSKLILLEGGLSYSTRSLSANLNGFGNVQFDCDYATLVANVILRKKISLFDVQIKVGASPSLAVGDNIFVIENLPGRFNFNAATLMLGIGAGIGYDITKEIRIGLDYDKINMESLSRPGPLGNSAYVEFDENWLSLSIARKFN